MLHLASGGLARQLVLSVTLATCTKVVFLTVLSCAVPCVYDDEITYVLRIYSDVDIQVRLARRNYVSRDVTNKHLKDFTMIGLNPK